MKHSELKRKVKKLGLEAIEKGEGIEIIYKNELVAWVSKDIQAIMKVFYTWPLSEELRVELFDILTEYARTPVEDREDEKKYEIYPIRTFGLKLIRYDESFRVFGYEDEVSFGITKTASCSEIETTVFSEDEAKEICDFFGWDFDKVAEEVEDDE